MSALSSRRCVAFLGVALVAIAALCPLYLLKTAWANYGDCVPLTQESYNYCPSAGNCRTLGCTSGSVSGCSGDNAILWQQTRTYGTACSSTWTNYTCSQCGEYDCAQGIGYQYMDAYGQCQNADASCNVLGVYYNCCAELTIPWTS